MEKNVSSVAEQDKTAEVKKNPKLIELARLNLLLQKYSHRRNKKLC